MIADVSLPGKNGIELAEELLGRKRNLKMLFISGYVGAEVLRFHNIPKADLHFPSKPFAAGELISRVEQVLAAPEQLRWLRTGHNDKDAGAEEGRYYKATSVSTPVQCFRGKFAKRSRAVHFG